MGSYSIIMKFIFSFYSPADIHVETKENYLPTQVDFNDLIKRLDDQFDEVAQKLKAMKQNIDSISDSVSDEKYDDQFDASTQKVSAMTQSVDSVIAGQS